MVSALQATAPVRDAAGFVGSPIRSGVIVVLIVVAWLAVPPIVRGQLESRLTETLGRPTTVEAVEFDPLRLRLTIRKLAIADKSAATPLFAFDELVADVSAASIWHRAPVLDAVKLVRPSLGIARDRNDRYNVQDLIDHARRVRRGRPHASRSTISRSTTARSHSTTGSPAGSTRSPASPSQCRSFRRFPTRPTSGSPRAWVARSTVRGSHLTDRPRPLPSAARRHSTSISTPFRCRRMSRICR